MGKILLCHVNMMQQGQIGVVARKLGHEIKVIPRGDYNKSLGELAGVLPADASNALKRSAYTGPELPKELMLFSGISSEELDDFLSAYRSAGVPPIPRKAVLTPGNIDWNILQTYEEMELNIKELGS